MVAWMWLVVRCFAAPSSPIPTPTVDGIDYDSPESYLALPDTLGSQKRIEQIAQEIPGDTFEAKLDGIAQWIGTHLEVDPDAAYHWADVDRIVNDGRYGGCADHALVYGALARALGIPTVWVKTMDVEWIRAFQDDPEPSSWNGHVFLEVHDGKRWLLLDAQAQRLYEDYETGARILPGDRYAYDKGGDPFEMVLSTRWEAWLEQTRTTFTDFDLARLPVPEGRPIDRDLVGHVVFVAASNPGWNLVSQRARSLGWYIGRSGNADFDDWMPEARGRTLVLVSVAGVEPLPEPYRSQYQRKDFVELAKAHRKDAGWVERWTADDGTRVVLLYGRDEAALAAAIAELTFDG